MEPELLPLTDIPDSVRAFVDGVLLPHLTAGQPKDTIWCSQWGEHPDAVHRLAAISDEWSHMLESPDASLHGFLRDVLDYHLPMLVDREKGSFRRCGQGRHSTHAQLDAVKPPPTP
ncbi:DUF4913 domain-containing protein [Salinibacterium sp. G-O1]|uniref:DUF4913 domain-containing protein n=1 Tax=Salinibacterium sp. G-O1 TaxID=3046208 RepID=UPI0024B8CF10|nr:DUF4913 domain-containing protein [Salinibacterium sp. G-O1]MDJ0336593.1 DUF4913 domain-containing protein [Salinibacterium sp. G-O1]